MPSEEFELMASHYGTKDKLEIARKMKESYSSGASAYPNVEIYEYVHAVSGKDMLFVARNAEDTAALRRSPHCKNIKKLL